MESFRYLFEEITKLPAVYYILNFLLAFFSSYLCYESFIINSVNIDKYIELMRDIRKPENKESKAIYYAFMLKYCIASGFFAAALVHHQFKGLDIFYAVAYGAAGPYVIKDRLTQDVFFKSSNSVGKKISEIKKEGNKEYDQIKEEVKHLRAKLDEIKNREQMDDIYNKRRLIAFPILDAFVDSCVNKQECPSCDDLEKYHDCLVDISTEAYREQRAYYYSLDRFGQDDRHRSIISISRIEKVLHCPKKTSLPDELFLKRIREIIKKEEKRLGIRNRKAFWSFLKFNPHHNPKADYESACEFVEKFHESFFWLNQGGNREDYGKLAKITSQLSNKLHILNGFELFQNCAIKNVISLKAEAQSF